MNQKKKLVLISNIPAPYQVKFVSALNGYYEAEGWFYESAAAQRDAFWNVSLSPYCRIIPKVRVRKNGRYITVAHLRMLRHFQPDVLLLSGFSIPANYLAYQWASRHGKKVFMITESSRTAAGVLRGNTFHWRFMRAAYSRIHGVLAVTPEAYSQFKNDLRFGNKVVQARYATDLDDYLSHPLRRNKEWFTVLFANRLTENYNPLAAIHIVYKALKAFPGLRLLMNGTGELRAQCALLIQELNLEASVGFLDNILHWDDLNHIYQESDILLLPAIFSAGNFTLYEAMASGMGIVISNQVLGNGPVIENGINGFRLPLDEDAMAHSVVAYATNAGLLAAHGALNKDIVRQLGVAGTAEFYYQLLSNFPAS